MRVNGIVIEQTNINIMTEKKAVLKETKRTKVANGRKVAKPDNQFKKERNKKAPSVLDPDQKILSLDEYDTAEEIDFNLLLTNFNDEVCFESGNGNAKELTHHSKYVKDRLEDYIQQISKIQVSNSGLSINVQSDKNAGFEVHSNLLRFYVPLFLLKLFENYGFQKEIQDLHIYPPRFVSVAEGILFKKDLILANREGVFIYSCTFRRAIKNYLSIDNVFVYTRISSIIENVYNALSVADPAKDPCRCDEASIRNSDFVCIPEKLYEMLNNDIFKYEKLTYED